MPQLLSTARTGEYCVLQYAAPGGPLHNIGILLANPETGKLYVRLRGRFDDIADEDDREVLEMLEQDLEREGGALLGRLEDSLSNTLRVTDRESIAVDSFLRAADRLLEAHVERPAVNPYVTHLPLYTLAAAATRFGEDMPVEEEDWVRVAGRKLDPGMFAAHVVGRSMEPRIPDGSLNLFRHDPKGTRQEKIVLVARAGVYDETARYTVKKYLRAGDVKRMVPLNPEFEEFTLGEGDRIIAEWLEVLE